ncbi:MAG: DUF1326 domain-containing protein [Alphaproteobacteria bacterium]|jgi:hypothetical protein|nr:DUF1326 domain-containing protein [Alphaproteobacteria bacterium]
MTDAAEWRLEGAYLENCNCEILCPCIVGPRSPAGGPMAAPTEGHCDVPMVFQIARGHYGETSLDGLHAALAIYTPGAMGAGDWTAGVYVDETGSEPQRQALEAIFSGRAGGPMGRFGAAVTTRLPTKVVAIRFEAEGRRRRAEIPGVLEIEVEGQEGADGNESWLDNVRHPVSPRLAIAKAIKGIFRDHAFDWDNTDLNAHYADFAWQGP